jgi:hypothetical protein
MNGTRGDQVFANVTVVAADPAQTNIKVIRRGLGFFQPGIMDKIFTKGSLLEVNVFPDVTLHAEVMQVDVPSTDTKVASAVLGEVGNATFTKVGAALAGYIEPAQGIFEVRGDGDDAIISELSPEPVLPCGTKGGVAERTIPQCSQEPPSGNDKVSVLIVYTPSVASENSADYLKALANTAITNANAAM